ncbi:MAG: hypothetical protein JWO46_1125, partial [Nocardioidaceae bacterium]|nr:hypothetical protein [Nocardioidaceae bacterium]
DPTRGVTLVQEAMNGSDKPDLVIPGVSSNEALAVAPLLERSRTVGIATVASALLNDPKKYPYFFSAAFPADDAVKAAAVFLAKQTGVKKVALVAPADAIGDATEQNFSASMKAQGLTGTTFRFPSDGVDYTPTFQKAASSGADWILMEGAGGQVPIMLSSREKAGADSIPTIVGPTASSQPLLDLAKGDQLTNLYPTLLPTQVYIDPAARSKEFSDFLARVMKQGDLVTPIQVYANGWDMVRIWANAVKRSDGKTDGATIKKALESEPAKKAGDQFPVYSGQYSASNHFHGGHPEDFTFAQLTGKKDGALLTK